MHTKESGGGFRCPSVVIMGWTLGTVPHRRRAALVEGAKYPSGRYICPKSPMPLSQYQIVPRLARSRVSYFLFFFSPPPYSPPTKHSAMSWHGISFTKCNHSKFMKWTNLCDVFCEDQVRRLSVKTVAWNELFECTSIGDSWIEFFNQSLVKPFIS